MGTDQAPSISQRASTGKRRQGDQEPPIIVIGTGPVGLRLVNELRRQDPDCRIELFGNQPWAPHDRVKLSSFLAGEIVRDEMDGASRLPDDENFRVYPTAAVNHIDRAHRAIVTRYGDTHEFRLLALSTGSQPLIPAIQGVGLEGVYTFRDVIDTHRLLSRKTRRRHSLILGGGLLGLECAKAMRRFNTRVTVIETNEHLLFRQLDDRGAGMLRRHMESLGVKVITHDNVRQVLGTYAVQAVELRSGLTLKCDTLILAVGTTPNIELARKAGLRTQRGILVNDRMQTSDPAIFAVGECTEHKGEIYGLIAPGYEQAKVAAQVMTGKSARYTGPLSMSEIRVVGLPVCSFGDVREAGGPRKQTQYMDDETGIYRKLILEGGCLIGVMALGPWPDIPRLREMVERQRRIRPWQLWRFRRTGTLWRDAQRAPYVKTSMG